jgi:ribosome-associated protein
MKETTVGLNTETKNTAPLLVETVIKGIQERKGSNITVVDLKGIDGAVADYFVICQGNSPTQVEAIVESVGDAAREQLDEKPIKAIGLGNNQWVAIDYVDVMVHIFLPETREYYDLENLWEDAKLTEIPDLD